MTKKRPKNKRAPAPGIRVQTVRLMSTERAHLEKLQTEARQKSGRHVPYNEIMVKGLMSLSQI